MPTRTRTLETSPNRSEGTAMNALTLPCRLLVVAVASAWCGSGIVTDSLGVPLQDIKVTRKSDGATTSTNAAGQWALTPPTGVGTRTSAPSSNESGLSLHKGRLTYSPSQGRQVDGRRVEAAGNLPEGERLIAGRSVAVVDSVITSGSGWKSARVPYDSKSSKNVVSTILVGSPGMVMIRGGYDSLGSKSQGNNPPHVVRVAGFWMDTVEVTQKLFDSLMRFNPSFHSNCKKCPVERVTWFDAIRFCNARSRAEGLPEAYDISSPDSLSWSWNPKSPGFRLPTDAEWEFAARAGESADWYWGNLIGSSTIIKYAWHNLNSGDSTHEVGKLSPNKFRLYDVSGNVAEWTWDWVENLTSDSAFYPKGPIEPTDRKTIRGGNFASLGVEIVVSSRVPSTPTTRWLGTGFRCVRGVTP